MLVFLTGCDEADSTGQENRKRASIAATAKYHHGQVEKPHWVKSEGTGSKSSSGNETGSTEEGSAPSPSSNPALSPHHPSAEPIPEQLAKQKPVLPAPQHSKAGREKEGGTKRSEKSLIPGTKTLCIQRGTFEKRIIPKPER